MDTSSKGVGIALANPLVLKLNKLGHLADAEKAYLTEMQGPERHYGAQREIWGIGDTLDRTFVVTSGWLMRYRLLTDGRRQIISIALPGDILALAVNYRRTSAYNLATITDCTLREVSPEKLAEAYGAFPRLASALSWAAVREVAVLGEHVVSLGRRTARERMLHVFLELWHRLSLVGLAVDRDFPIPMSQSMISDWLGLSEVHVNRTLRGLEREGLVSREPGRVVLNDVAEIAEVAEYRGGFIEDFALS